MIIDVTRLVRRAYHGCAPNGIDRVSLAYVRHYEAAARALVWWPGGPYILDERRSRALWGALLAPAAVPRPELLRLLGRGVLSAARGRRDRQGLRGALCFNTGHSGLERPGYGQRLRGYGLRPVFMIHDLIPLTHPEYCGPPARDRHARRIDAALNDAAALITNSCATRRDLERHAQARGRALPLTVTAPLAPGIAPARQAPVAEDGAPYFVMLGTIEARKNHWMILQVWRGLIERLGAAAPRLLLIGQRGWECENVIDLLERCAVLRGYVSERSDCSDQELGNCLRRARALLFASFTEGYGMPLVEALSLGVPAIVSNLPVFREVAGGVPEYIDPLDGRRWAEVVTDYAATDSALRARQLERMAGFEPPTWAEHFAIVDDLVRQL